MVSEDRLDWLLGQKRPARVIPAGLVRDPVGEIPDEHHTPLRELDPPQPAPGDHPHAVSGHENHVFDYPRGSHRDYEHDPHHHHQVLVSVSHPELLEDHLANASIWIRAAHPDEIVSDRGPQPLYLHNLVEQAVTLVTGSSLEKLWEGASDDRPGNLYDVLGDRADLVRRVAAEALPFRLEPLLGAGVIDGEDIDALDAESLIDALLSERRDDDDLDPNEATIVTTVLPPPGARQVRFSMRIKE